MKKIFSFSLLLILGLAASQILPGMLGESYPAFRAGATTFLYVCLSFIMINVGREFEIDKKRWRSYAEDYFIAMATAGRTWGPLPPSADRQPYLGCSSLCTMFSCCCRPSFGAMATPGKRICC